MSIDHLHGAGEDKRSSVDIAHDYMRKQLELARRRCASRQEQEFVVDFYKESYMVLIRTKYVIERNNSD